MYNIYFPYTSPFLFCYTMYYNIYFPYLPPALLFPYFYNSISFSFSSLIFLIPSNSIFLLFPSSIIPIPSFISISIFLYLLSPSRIIFSLPQYCLSAGVKSGPLRGRSTRT
uniref:Uncharacterized protein n=1 Tax=Cacopsylla melanoneura TaxID=428564 RepID=A0A8D9F752_9HEMI